MAATTTTTATATTANHDMHHPIPALDDEHIKQGYGASAPESSRLNTASTDPAASAGHPADMLSLGRSMSTHRPSSAFGRHEELDDDRGSTIQQLEGAGLHRTASGASAAAMSRTSTLKKRGSVSRKSSLKRSNSRRSTHAGSLKGVSIEDKKELDQSNSIFYTPIPTSGSPTELLANRFQVWRKVLKDLITYFREVQVSYEHKSKALLKVSNLINNTAPPTIFVTEGGLAGANRILRDYHMLAITEANKAKDIEQDVITQLTGLRQDLSAKIKEIKSLSGDFKNSVEKEKEGTKKAINALGEALNMADRDPQTVTGRDDPYIIKLSVDRQVERQIDEENYLHRAYLNLEGSGRELESIVVGEVQKAYNALAGILKREADGAYDAIDQLRYGPITVPKDQEWTRFIEKDPHFVSPDVEPRKLEEIHYPGKDHPAAAEVRAGMLERKSKYLKSYTPGWYVLSPTHLHEFKSADRIYTQPPVMSLYLADQKLGSHSQPGSSSHKFMLKGKQTGSMHRGHSWVFRAESYDTMLAWYDDIKSLTEKSGEERNAFVRKHARSFSNTSGKAGSVSGESAMEEDEADETPFSATESLAQQEKSTPPPQRPSPGGRFPSDLSANQYAQRPASLSEGSSDDREIVAAALGLPQHHGRAETALPKQGPTMTATAQAHAAPPASVPTQVPAPSTSPHVGGHHYQRQHSDYGSWMAPAAGGAAVGAAAIGAEEHRRHKRKEAEEREAQQARQRQAEMNIEPVAVPVHPPTRESVEVSDRALSEAQTSPAVTDSTMPTSVSAPDQEANNISPMPSTAPVLLVPIPVPEHAAQPIQPPAPAPAPEPAPILAEPLPKQAAPPAQPELVPVPIPTVPIAVNTETAYNANRDGVADGPRTGAVPPAVRHNTDTSISNLHIPGEFPRGAGF